MSARNTVVLAWMGLMACVQPSSSPDEPQPAADLDTLSARPEPAPHVPDSIRGDRPSNDTAGGGPSWLLDQGVVDTEAMHVWIRGQHYRRWVSSSNVFPSAEGGSRVFLNPVLASSLESGSSIHPVGAVGVRELYTDDFLRLKAVNLLIKTIEGQAPDGHDWLWVEVTDFRPGATPSVEAPAAEGCVACHAAGGGADLIQSTWPLR
ncbi:MAG: hypothetical protein AAFX99_09495 [Myxococcota bacterium]